MFKRKIYSKLTEWKNKKDHKPLIIKGARQVGKTTLVKEFSKNNYENVLYFDFRSDLSLHKIFDENFDIDKITLLLSAKFPNCKLEPKKTILIFDEIQDCPNARSCLKYFCLDGRYDVICTGSLLGIKGYRKTNKQFRGIPVGYEEYLEMTSMDFEEFLWANDVNVKLINNLYESFNNLKKIDNFLHEYFLDLFNKFICIGGMPEVVKTFIETNNLNEVYLVQRRIIQSYESDFGTHLNDNLTTNIDRFAYSRILECFHSIPAQLAKENKKFQFSKIKQGAKSRDYYDAVEWLEDAGIIARCYNVSTIEKPLNIFTINNIYKIYMRDTGLLISMFDPGTSFEILNGNLGIAKGAIYENIIADGLVKLEKKLYYFQKNSGLEIDFIINQQNELNILEVKATSGKAKSVKIILTEKDKYKVNKCIKLTNQNIGISNDILTIPYYLVFLL